MNSKPYPLANTNSHYLSLNITMIPHSSDHIITSSRGRGGGEGSSEKF